MTKTEFIQQFVIHHNEMYSTINLLGCAEAMAKQLEDAGYTFDIQEESQITILGKDLLLQVADKKYNPNIGK